MTHQLVFKFPTDQIDDINFFQNLETQVEGWLTPIAKLDGHDYGMGEFNIFIHTSDPTITFQVIAEKFLQYRPDLEFAAGCRGFEQETYTPLWPHNAKTFAVA